MPGFNMQDYVSVAERLALSKDDVAHIQTDPPVMLSEALGYIRATITLKDNRTATGTAHFRLDAPGRGPEATDALEKCETSAIGRALKHLGYPISREELDRIEQNRAQEQAPPPSTVNRTMTVREAETRFWDKFAGPLGGTEWARVVALVGEWPQPITLPEWIAAGKAVHDALTAEVNKGEV